MEAAQPGYKKEVEEGALIETVFDKWNLLAQVCWQIVVADRSLIWKLQRTQDLLSHLTPQEKEIFNITMGDEQKLNDVLSSIRLYDQVLSSKLAFTKDFLLTRRTLSVEEKRSYLTRPERERYNNAVHWDRRSLTLEGEAKLVAEAIGDHSLFGVQVEPENIYCKLKPHERTPDSWKGEDRRDCDNYQFYDDDEIEKLDFGEDDPLIWRVSFYVRGSYLLGQIQNRYHQQILEARKLIGSILQKMMKQLEGKTVYVIPEERKIP